MVHRFHSRGMSGGQRARCELTKEKSANQGEGQLRQEQYDRSGGFYDENPDGAQGRPIAKGDHKRHEEVAKGRYQLLGE
jgi:hypothetical protein